MGDRVEVGGVAVDAGEALDQAAVEIGVEVVYLIILVAGGAGELLVAVQERAGGVAEHFAGEVGHAPEVGLGGGDRVVFEEDGDAGDAFGVVGDAFEIGGDRVERDQLAQVAGDRLLERDQVEHGLLDLVAQLVDGGVAVADAAGEHEVAAQQRLHRVDDAAVGAGVQQAQSIDRSLSIVGVCGARHEENPGWGSRARSPS